MNSPSKLHCLQARVNVPGLGERALRTSIANSGFYITSELQVLLCSCVYCYYGTVHIMFC